jgi:hypothetical protein
MSKVVSAPCQVMVPEIDEGQPAVLLWPAATTAKKSYFPGGTQGVHPTQNATPNAAASRHIGVRSTAFRAAVDLLGGS